jgi:hypothetical protein
MVAAAGARLSALAGVGRVGQGIVLLWFFSVLVNDLEGIAVVLLARTFYHVSTTLSP